MELIPKDTTLEAYRYQIEVLRKLGPEGRSLQMGQLCRNHRASLIEGIRQRHPEYTEREIKYALIRLLIGRSLFEQLIPGVKIEP